MVRISIQLTEEQAKTLKKLAKACKTSVSKLAREGVMLFLVEHSNQIANKEKRQRALAGLKKIKDMKYRDMEGKTGPSTNHDQYLEEIYAS